VDALWAMEWEMAEDNGVCWASVDLHGLPYMLSPYRSFRRLSLTLGLAHKLSTYSSIPQLAESTPANDISSAPPDSTSAAANKTKEQQRRYHIRMLHKVVDEADVIVPVFDAHDPAGVPSRLVETKKRYAGAK
jgi:hypothetical protein